MFDKILRLKKEVCIYVFNYIPKSREDKFLRRKETKCYYAQGKSKNEKSLLKRTYFKVISFSLAFLLIGAALVIPTTTLAPDVEAIANKKAIALSVGDLEDFSNVIVSNCKAEETVPVTEQETTVQPTTEAKTEPETTEQPTTEAVAVTTEETTEKVTEATEPTTEKTEVAQHEEKVASSVISEVSNSVSNSNYLLSISNPDPNYVPGTIKLTDSDRNLLERLVMGEAGSLGFTGCALIAQSVRDTMVLEGITSVSDVISRYNYSGSTSVKANSSAVKAVNFIFDQNGSAVQHRILYMYESSICSSPWHESQNYVVSYGSVKFLDKW